MDINLVPSPIVTVDSLQSGDPQYSLFKLVVLSAITVSHWLVRCYSSWYYRPSLSPTGWFAATTRGTISHYWLPLAGSLLQPVEPSAITGSHWLIRCYSSWYHQPSLAPIGWFTATARGITSHHCLPLADLLGRPLKLLLANKALVPAVPVLLRAYPLRHWAVT
jgi:hypothetical protein